MIGPGYKAQVSLLLNVLHYVAKEKAFALKGGTAINMFVTDMPRLSVDIDLTYKAFDTRDAALRNISESLLRIKNDILQNTSAIQVTGSGIIKDQIDKLRCVRKGVKVKIEVNTTMRGIIKPVRLRQTSPSVRSEFDTFAAIEVVSDAELFGGKICAALDRQHPRDIFDIRQLFEGTGITQEIKEGFITSLLSCNRPINEMLKPNLHNQKEVFTKQFAGMALRPFSYNDFEMTRIELIKQINNLLTSEDKALLLSFKAGDPKWHLSNVDQLQHLPAVKWKLHNIRKLRDQDPLHHKALLQKLEQVL